MVEAVAQNALLASPEKALPPTPQLIADVARKHGVGAFTQLGQMMKMRYGRQGIDFLEYYDNRLYHPDYSPEQKSQFVGARGSKKLNDLLSPRAATKTARAFISDKVYYSSMIAQLGFPTTETQAVVSKKRSFGNIPSLRTESDLENFLTSEARYPLFVKPEVGSGSVGSALINGVDQAKNELKLYNGKKVRVQKFVEEVFQDYEEGLLIQSAVAQCSTLTQVAGKAIGTIRVVTILKDDEPSLLYTLWKVPSPDAMSDNYWQDGSMIADIDAISGHVLQCRRGKGLSREILETHPVSGQSFREIRIPHWDQVIDITTRCHKLFPQFGVFGWDIAITENGPLIIECNANPHHMLYQLATGKGIYHEEFAPSLEAVISRGEDNVAELKLKARKSKSK